MYPVAICVCLVSAVVLADEFTYTVTNQMKDPMFTESQTFTITENKALLGYMRDAVMMFNDRFTSFQVNFTKPNGYLVNAINGVYADYNFDKTYWGLSNETDDISQGVSSYMPHSGEHITLKLTKDMR